MAKRTLLYASAIFLNAFLLFAVQPMIAKAILPWFGGTAGVWITCVMFFQLTLLLGYVYADRLTTRFSARTQAVVHVTLLGASVLALPLVSAPAWKPAAGRDPALDIVLMLTASVGLPYFVLSTTSPLLQFWYARASGASMPYRLYAISNLGSMLALLSYPVLIETAAGTRVQLAGWAWVYAVCAALCAATALVGICERGQLSQPAVPAAQEPQSAPPLRDQVLWFLLAAAGASLLLATTNHLTQTLAAIPFLWILPLSLYLLSFIITFDRPGWYRPGRYRLPLAVVLAGMGYGVLKTGPSPRLMLIIPLLSGGLFLACLFCHGELVRLKPHPRFLTRFYLMISAGGAAGGIFVSLLAPRVFRSYVEFPITLTVCALLALYLTFAVSWRAQVLWGAVTMYLVLCTLGFVRRDPGELLRTRNFYGLLEVRYVTDGPEPYRVLRHGGIVHGVQLAGEGRSRRPTTYYGPASGIGAAIASRRPGPLRIGVVGLGAGTLAAYGQPGDYFRFYEINPQVLEVAGSHFRFLRESPAKVDVLIGDGRLLLERDPPQAFDILAVDAFSGDAIPVHLLTREALAVYARHLKPDGLLALHISNAYLDLRHVTGRLAQAAGWDAVLIEDHGDKSQLTLPSLWVLAGRNAALKPLQRGKRLVSAPGDLWTDDYSNLYRTLR